MTSLPGKAFCHLSIYKCLSIRLHDHSREREGLALKPEVNNLCWMTVVASTDRPDSVRNRFELKRFIVSLC